MSKELLLYEKLAHWWPLLSPPDDYAEEAAFYSERLREASEEASTTCLELGSGGGNNAYHMKHLFQMSLVDIAPRMLEVSKKLNPECEHIEGDMRSIRLEQSFDCVFVHDAIVYMLTEDDLRATVETCYVHCRPGGSVLLAPDHVQENFKSSTDHGGNDGEKRSLRYLEWTWDPDPNDTTYNVDYVYLLREGKKPPIVEYERHIEGLFPRDKWLSILTEVGFSSAKAIPFNHSEVEPGTWEVFVAVRPS